MSIIELPPEMAVGFRFYPTDEELIKYYLKPKLLGEDSEVDQVAAVVDFCNIEPWNLPLESKMTSKDRTWLFFCVQRLKLVKKSSKKKAMTESADMIWKITGKKKTGTGSWKITGEEKEIKDQNTGECIGKKRNLVFDKTHKNKKWVMQEFYIIPDNPVPNQSIYVLRRLKEKPNNKVKTPDGGEGEPSGDIRSEVEDSATPAAISSAHGNEEVNQELLPQPFNSPVCELTDDEISLLSSVGFLRGHNETQAFCGTGEREELPQEFLDSPAGAATNAEGVDVESPHAICHLEKTDERAGGLGCHEGEPGGDIIDDMNNPVAPALISEEQGRKEVNSDLLSQALLSLDYCDTGEDMRLLSSGCPNDGQQFNSGTHKYNPESENYVPHKGPYAISGSENITDEVTGNPGCDIVVKSSGYTTSGIEYQAASAATDLEVHANTEVNGEYLSPDDYLTEEDIRCIFAGSFSDGYNNSQALCGADEPEESPAEFLEGLKVKPDENFCGTTSTLFNDSIHPKSLKRSCPLDAPARVDTDVGGVDGRVKRPRSLALGESLQ